MKRAHVKIAAVVESLRERRNKRGDGRHAFVTLDSNTLPGALVVSMASNPVPLTLVP